MSSSVVETWLQTLGFHQYTEAFIDNGYDDLEVCRQIGEADLDAIGVTTAEDRADLLSAVNELQKCRCVNEHEVTSNVCPVYFTLENPGDMTTKDPEVTNEDPGDISAAQSSTCVRRLSLLVRERLTDDVITLIHPPYVSQVRINLSIIHHYHRHHHHLAV